MKLFVSTLLLLWSSVAFSQDNSEETKLDFTYFNTHLKREMNKEEIVEFFGKPSRDRGSGIYVYEYDLSDSTTVVIGCAHIVFYAYHSDKKGKVLDQIITK